MRPVATMPEFGGMPRTELERLAQACAVVEECACAVRAAGGTIIDEMLCGQAVFLDWNHYPEDDVYDRDSHAQYYYHAHPKAERPAEHGHFHTFLRPKGMPPRAKPADVAGNETPPGENEALSHLVAISMDESGAALGLFTTNRWVTGETWYEANDVIAMIDCFRIDHGRPSRSVNRWLTAMIALFRPQIRLLLLERDETVANWKRAKSSNSVFDDRDLEITSHVDISVADQMQRVRAALQATESGRSL